MPLNDVPYWRLSGLYFFYFTAVGVILPYWGLYLASLGFSSAEIGAVVAVPMFTKILAPNLWGWLADRTGRYLLVIRIGAICAVVLFAGVTLRTDFWGLALFAVLFSFFWNAVLPQFEVITLDALGENAHHYSRVRLWGSLGFIFAVLVLGVVFDQLGVSLLPAVMWVLLGCIALVTFTVPETAHHTSKVAGTGLWQTFKQPAVVYFFAASILLHISHGVFYGFYSIHLSAHGYSNTLIGILWAVGVVAEIAIFIKIPTLFARFNLWQCYLWGMVASSVRWVLVGYFPQVEWLMFIAQLLHALTFGVTHAVAIELVRRVFGRGDRGKAQALYSALCFGAGGALGAYSSGIIWDYGPGLSFGFATAASLVAGIVVYFGMRVFRT